jgi:hypothetical protein
MGWILVEEDVMFWKALKGPSVKHDANPFEPSTDGACLLQRMEDSTRPEHQLSSELDNRNPKPVKMSMPPEIRKRNTVTRLDEPSTYFNKEVECCHDLRLPEMRMED